MADTTNAPPDAQRKSPSTDSVTLEQAVKGGGVAMKYLRTHAVYLAIVCSLLGINFNSLNKIASKQDVADLKKYVDSELTPLKSDVHKIAEKDGVSLANDTP